MTLIPSRPSPFVLFVALTLGMAPGALGQCPQWSTEFSTPGADGPMHAHAVVQWGGTSQILVGGGFGWIGTVEAPRLALFDGTNWSGFPSGAPGTVLAVAQYDDGTGSKIYVGGDGFLAIWDGVAWSSLNVTGEITALHVHDDGNGDVLFAGGNFDWMDGAYYKDIARYDGTWDNLAGGTPNPGNVRAFATHDDGTGPALYVGGRFDTIGGATADGLARWDGSTFTEVAGGVQGGNGRTVKALQSYTPPGGSAELHIGGRFTGIGGVSTSNWVIWRQGTIVNVGGGQEVSSFVLRNDTSGSTICAERETKVESYDGANRTSFSFNAPPQLTHLVTFGQGLPQDLFVSSEENNETGSFLSQWDGASWEPLYSGPGIAMGLPDYVEELAVHDFGAGERLLALTPPGWVSDGQYLQYDGASWSPLVTTGDFPGSIYDSMSHDGTLYVSGTGAGGLIGVTRLVGHTWERVGDSFSVSGPYGHSVAMFDAGAGPELYFGGHSVGDLAGPNTIGITRFDGVNWVSVGGGITQPPVFSVASTVYDLQTWHDGTTEGLYAGGAFREVGGVPANAIARWDGQNWSALGGGIWTTLPVQPTVTDMVRFDGPSGEQLIAAGIFDRAGSIAVNSIAAWDGTQWSRLGAGLQSGGEPGVVWEMIAHDPDGQGERLYVYGSFDTAGTIPAESVAVWDGVAWSSTDLPYTHQVTLETYDDGAGRSLFIGGSFSGAAGVGSLNIAKLTDPCGAMLGIPTCTSNPNSTGFVGLTRATGSASVNDADLTVLTRRLPPNVFTLFFTGTGLQHGVAGDGVLCVQGSLMRMSPGGFANASGVSSQPFDFQAPYAANAVPGQTLVIQGFYRDAAGGPAGFNTTDALQIAIQL